MRRTLSFGFTICLFAAGLLLRVSDRQIFREQTFSPPIDGLSVNAGTVGGRVSALDGGTWTSWQTLALDDEEDPGSHESNLILFPHAVSRIRFSDAPGAFVVHPIRLSQEPVRYAVASRTYVPPPRILTRSEWGADESIGLVSGAGAGNGKDSDKEANPTVSTSNPSGLTQREKDCLEAQRLYPDEFRTTGKTVTKNENGDTLRWPRTYSPWIRLIVVHHTAMEVTTDTSRSSMDRIRALYQYHANSRAWGDVGYNYIIDENGQVYEGRAGGDNVIGGHAYCNNTGTIGVALMGNFDVEQPPQQQMQSLQWLLDFVGNKYGLDLKRSVTYHGKILPAIVGHRDLLSTSCPGYYVAQTLDQVRNNVRTGQLQASINFPPPPPTSSSSAAPVSLPASRRSPRLPSTVAAFGLSALGQTSLTARPGGETAIAVLYHAGPAETVWEQSVLGTVGRSDPRIGVWVAKGDQYQRVRLSLLSPQRIDPGTAATLRLRVLVPRERGTFTVSIGPATYTIVTEGKVIHDVITSRTDLPQTYQSYTPPARTDAIRPVNSRSTYVPVSSAISSDTMSTIEAPPAPRSSSEVGSVSSVPPAWDGRGSPIRIRLHDLAGGSTTAASLSYVADPSVNALKVAAGTITLAPEGNDCTARQNGKLLFSGVVRIDPNNDGVAAITSWKKANNRFRGIIECRNVDGELVLINELPLETYMAGLAEEPDTEPVEKQKAFAVAARTYAAFYMDPSHRKFPGQPYDGSDSPAEFQIYGGVAFGETNPRWLSVARDTANQVLTAGGEVLKTPYFSADDGKTRAPADVGWTTFPHAEIFAAKQDPWCRGMTPSGHGVGMSGCGARGQANEGKNYQEILQYYYPGAAVGSLR